MLSFLFSSLRIVMRFTINQKSDVISSLQKQINIEMKKELIPDGVFGPITILAWKNYQLKLGMTPVEWFDTEVHKNIYERMCFRFLSNQDIKDQASAAGIDPRVLFAIRSVEGKGAGFLPDGRPLILFERHIFYREYAKKFGRAKAKELQQSVPNICHPVWDKTAYKGYGREYDRLELAATYDKECAHRAASWGMFQILGQNYEVCGFSSAVEFSAKMRESEDFHLAAVIKFIKGNPKLYAAVKIKDFVAIATIYNGPAQAQNGYAVKMEDAYEHGEF